MKYFVMDSSDRRILAEHQNTKINMAQGAH